MGSSGQPNAWLKSRNLKIMNNRKSDGLMDDHPA